MNPVFKGSPEETFVDDTMEVRCNGRLLEGVVQCHATEGWAQVAELDYRTGERVLTPEGQPATVRVEGVIELMPRPGGPSGGGSPGHPQPPLSELDLAGTSCECAVCAPGHRPLAGFRELAEDVQWELIQHTMRQVAETMAAQHQQGLLATLARSPSGALSRWPIRGEFVSESGGVVSAGGVPPS